MANFTGLAAGLRTEVPRRGGNPTAGGPGAHPSTDSCRRAVATGPSTGHFASSALVRRQSPKSMPTSRAACEPRHWPWRSTKPPDPAIVSRPGGQREQWCNRPRCRNLRAGARNTMPGSMWTARSDSGQPPARDRNRFVAGMESGRLWATRCTQVAECSVRPGLVFCAQSRRTSSGDRNPRRMPHAQRRAYLTARRWITAGALSTRKARGFGDARGDPH